MKQPSATEIAQISKTIIAMLEQMKAKSTDAVTDHTSIVSELNLDSIQMLELISLLESKYNVDILGSLRGADEISTPYRAAVKIYSLVAQVRRL